MKKNVKILGAAAAALLAVAPVVASATTVNAETVIGGSQAKPDNPTTGNVITISGSVSSFNVNSSKVSDLTTRAAVINALKVTSNVSGDNPVVTGVHDTVVSDASTGGNAQTGNLVPGKTYWVQTVVNISNLHAGQGYTIDGYQAIADSQGAVNGVPVAYSFVAQDPNAQGNPYFTYASGSQVNQTIGNGEYANGSIEAASNTGALLTNAKRYVNALVNINGAHLNASITTTAADIAQQLRNQGVSVNNDGGITANANSRYYVTLTAVNPQNSNRSTTVHIWVNSTENQYQFPAIYQSMTNGTVHNLIAQGSNQIGTVHNVTFKQNSQDAKDFAANPLKNFVALNSTDSQPVNYDTNNYDTNVKYGKADLAVARNSVDPTKAGIYQVSLRATNRNGLSTTTTFNVTINPTSGHRTGTIHYVPGYGVNIWNVRNNTVSFTGRRQPAGSTVTIYGERSANGVRYYAINQAQTEFVQASYIDGTSADNNKPSNNGETKLNGVGRVSYNGKGSVRLLNANGHYVDQYVKKGSSFKVWAEKTVNGQHLYRIGSQSQWIPAKYFSLN